MGLAFEFEHGMAPPWLHIRCEGGANREGRGWAWHDDDGRRSCFDLASVSAPADLVADAIDGRLLPGIDRLLAIARLRELIPGGIPRIFRNPCPVCGENHLERATRALRILKLIHPDVVDLLRAARVPESLLVQPRYLKRGDLPSREPKKSRYTLPVWKGEVARTRAAQIMFALRQARMNGIDLGGLGSAASGVSTS